MSTGFGSGNQLERRMTDLERKFRLLSLSAMSGIVASVGTFSLSTGAATSTVVTDATVTAASKVFYVPNDSGAWSVDGALNNIIEGAGQFTVSHQASSLTRTYNYIVVNPV